MIVSDELYFADPSTFNDPLDSKPCLEVNVNEMELRGLLNTLVQQRVLAEMSSAANSLNYRGPKTKQHIERYSQKAGHGAVDNVLCLAGGLIDEHENVSEILLAVEIERELLQRYEAGIFSLAERPNCPLMWSHYGEQHKGLCIGYSIPECSNVSVRKVEYDRERTVRASDVLAMLNGDQLAKEQVDGGVLLHKAPSWSYEGEWRLTGNRGVQRSPLELEEITFGLRCAMAVKFAVCNALKNRARSVSFYEIVESRPTFELTRREVNVEELASVYPLRSLDSQREFVE